MSPGAPDPDNSERIVLHRALSTQDDQLCTLEEARYPKGFGSKCFRELITNGMFCMPFATNWVVQSNGKAMPEFDTNDMFVIAWPTNQSYLWWKVVKPDGGTNLASRYQQYIAAGRTMAWTNANATADWGGARRTTQ